MRDGYRALGLSNSERVKSSWTRCPFGEFKLCYALMSQQINSAWPKQGIKGGLAAAEVPEPLGGPSGT